MQLTALVLCVMALTDAAAAVGSSSFDSYAAWRVCLVDAALAAFLLLVDSALQARLRSGR